MGIMCWTKQVGCCNWQSQRRWERVLEEDGSCSQRGRKGVGQTNMYVPSVLSVFITKWGTMRDVLQFEMWFVILILGSWSSRPNHTVNNSVHLRCEQWMEQRLITVIVWIGDKDHGVCDVSTQRALIPTQVVSRLSQSTPAGEVGERPGPSLVSSVQLCPQLSDSMWSLNLLRLLFSCLGGEDNMRILLAGN